MKIAVTEFALEQWPKHCKTHGNKLEVQKYSSSTYNINFLWDSFCEYEWPTYKQSSVCFFYTLKSEQIFSWNFTSVSKLTYTSRHFIDSYENRFKLNSEKFLFTILWSYFFTLVAIKRIWLKMKSRAASENIHGGSFVRHINSLPKYRTGGKQNLILHFSPSVMILFWYKRFHVYEVNWMLDNIFLCIHKKYFLLFNNGLNVPVIRKIGCDIYFSLNMYQSIDVS